MTAKAKSNGHKEIANSPKTRNGRGNPGWFKGMPSPNPKGRPADGESWAGVLRWAGNITGEYAAKITPPEMAQEFRKLGRLTLKEAVTLRAFAALLFDPTSGMLNAVMDRAEGKLATPTHEMNGEEWRDWLKQNNGYTDADIDSLVSEFAAHMGAGRTGAASLPDGETADGGETANH